MKFQNSYRTVLLQLNPDKDAERELKMAMEWVQSFIEMRKIDIQKMLYKMERNGNELIKTLFNYLCRGSQVQQPGEKYASFRMNCGSETHDPRKYSEILLGSK